MNFILSLGFVCLVCGRKQRTEIRQRSWLYFTYYLTTHCRLITVQYGGSNSFLFAILYSYTSAKFSFNMTFNSDIKRHPHTHPHTHTHRHTNTQKRILRLIHKLYYKRKFIYSVGIHLGQAHFWFVFTQ